MSYASDSAVVDLAQPATLGAFAGFGLELEYMIVSNPSLDVLPIADAVFDGAPGETQPGELVHGRCGWSNELTAHVVELKNVAPTDDLASLPAEFQHEIAWLDARLRDRSARLMPGGMHPWMDPFTQTRLWPHNDAVYRAYDRIFHCRSHGWANVQSTHINLPFGDDREFARLHAAVRVVLPVIPAIAASSPFLEGSAPGMLDCRMAAYRANASLLPSITGHVIPETVSSRAEYERRILRPMYCDIAPHDGGRVLQHEWLNSRGAIARFNRNAIEIRVMDVQECPRADVALAALITEVTRALYEERFAPLTAQRELSTEALARIFLDCVHDAEQAAINDRAYLRLFGMRRNECDSATLWSHIANRVAASGAQWLDLWAPMLELVCARGTLARRILNAAGRMPERTTLRAIYEALCHALVAGELFEP